jgi:hypothetical protein
MADHSRPHSSRPIPIEPRTPLPGQDENFPGQPPIIERDKRSRGANRPRRPGNVNDDATSPGHIESEENVERDLPR